MIAPLRLIATARRRDLAERAARLWPESSRNQREWIRAVCLVRRTRMGWLLDRPVAQVDRGNRGTVA